MLKSKVFKIGSVILKAYTLRWMIQELLSEETWLGLHITGGIMAQPKAHLFHHVENLPAYSFLKMAIGYASMDITRCYLILEINPAFNFSVLFSMILQVQYHLAAIPIRYHTAWGNHCSPISNHYLFLPPGIHD